jgi:hypothetical protein
VEEAFEVGVGPIVVLGLVPWLHGYDLQYFFFAFIEKSEEEK